MIFIDLIDVLYQIQITLKHNSALLCIHDMVNIISLQFINA